MTFYSDTALLPPNPTPPYRCIEDIVITLWVEYLELEFDSPYNNIVTIQRMQIINQLIGYWEYKQDQIYCYELEKG